MAETRIGDYRIFYLPKLSPVGHSGWVVMRDVPKGGLGEVKSKHKTKRAAVAWAKDYIAKTSGETVNNG